MIKKKYEVKAALKAAMVYIVWQQKVFLVCMLVSGCGWESAASV